MYVPCLESGTEYRPHTHLKNLYLYFQNFEIVVIINIIVIQFDWF